MQLYRCYVVGFMWVLLLLAGCNQVTNPEYKSTATNPVTRKNNVLESPEQVRTFLNLYVPTDTFPINISTKAGEWEGPESANFKWRGNIIPRVFWPVFISQISYDPLAEDLLFFATKGFRVSKATWALLTRVPGEYWSSQVYLFLFNTQTHQITNGLRVAEAWGDAGDSFYLEATIDKVPGNKFRIILNQGECHPVDETYEQFTCADSVKTYLLQNQAFRFISVTSKKK